jgi:hypothetical protein
MTTQLEERNKALVLEAFDTDEPLSFPPGEGVDDIDTEG